MQHISTLAYVPCFQYRSQTKSPQELLADLQVQRIGAVLGDAVTGCQTPFM